MAIKIGWNCPPLCLRAKCVLTYGSMVVVKNMVSMPIWFYGSSTWMDHLKFVDPVFVSANQQSKWEILKNAAEKCLRSITGKQCKDPVSFCINVLLQNIKIWYGMGRYNSLPYCRAWCGVHAMVITSIGTVEANKGRAPSQTSRQNAMAAQETHDWPFKVDSFLLNSPKLVWLTIGDSKWISKITFAN